MNSEDAVALAIGHFVLAFTQAAPEGVCLTLRRESSPPSTIFDARVRKGDRLIGESYWLLDAEAFDSQVSTAAINGQRMGERFRSKAGV